MIWFFFSAVFGVWILNETRTSFLYGETFPPGFACALIKLEAISLHINKCWTQKVGRHPSGQRFRRIIRNVLFNRIGTRTRKCYRKIRKMLHSLSDRSGQIQINSTTRKRMTQQRFHCQHLRRCSVVFVLSVQRLNGMIIAHMSSGNLTESVTSWKSVKRVTENLPEIAHVNKRQTEFSGSDWLLDPTNYSTRS